MQLGHDATEPLGKYPVIEYKWTAAMSSEPAPEVTGAWLMSGKDSKPLGSSLGLRRHEAGFALYLEADSTIDPMTGDLLRLELDGEQTLFLHAEQIYQRALGSPALAGLEIRARIGYVLKAGEYWLNLRLRGIDRELQALAAAVSERGSEVVNLSPESRLQAFPSENLADFLGC